MANPLPADTPHYTYADLLSWPADERWELIDGIVYAMTPAPSRCHQEISMALALQFGLFLRGKSCRVYSAPFDVRLPKPNENSLTTSTVVQPDLTVVGEREKLDARGCLGAPTLVAEISPRRPGQKTYARNFTSTNKQGSPNTGSSPPSNGR